LGTRGLPSGVRVPRKERGNEMRSKLSLIALAAGLLLRAAASAFAHHAFAAEFDAKKPVKLRGTVTKMEWINPHTWIYMDVKKDDGTVDEWMIEAGTPNTLLRRGFTRESLKAGTVILVDGYQSKDGSLRANGRNLTLPNGQTLFLSNSAEEEKK